MGRRKKGAKKGGKNCSPGQKLNASVASLKRQDTDADLAEDDEDCAEAEESVACAPEATATSDAAAAEPMAAQADDQREDSVDPAAQGEAVVEPEVPQDNGEPDTAVAEDAPGADTSEPAEEPAVEAQEDTAAVDHDAHGAADEDNKAAANAAATEKDAANGNKQASAVPVEFVAPAAEEEEEAEEEAAEPVAVSKKKKKNRASRRISKVPEAAKAAPPPEEPPTLDEKSKKQGKRASVIPAAEPAVADAPVDEPQDDKRGSKQSKRASVVPTEQPPAKDAAEEDDKKNGKQNKRASVVPAGPAAAPADEPQEGKKGKQNKRASVVPAEAAEDPQDDKKSKQQSKRVSVVPEEAPAAVEASQDDKKGKQNKRASVVPEPASEPVPALEESGGRDAAVETAAATNDKQGKRQSKRASVVPEQPEDPAPAPAPVEDKRSNGQNKRASVVPEPAPAPAPAAETTDKRGKRLSQPNGMRTSVVLPPDASPAAGGGKSSSAGESPSKPAEPDASLNFSVASVDTSLNRSTDDHGMSSDSLNRSGARRVGFGGDVVDKNLGDLDAEAEQRRQKKLARRSHYQHAPVPHPPAEGDGATPEGVRSPHHAPHDTKANRRKSGAGRPGARPRFHSAVDGKPAAAQDDRRATIAVDAIEPAAPAAAPIPPTRRSPARRVSGMVPKEQFNMENPPTSPEDEPGKKGGKKNNKTNGRLSVVVEPAEDSGAKEPGTPEGDRKRGVSPKGMARKVVPMTGEDYAALSAPIKLPEVMSPVAASAYRSPRGMRGDPRGSTGSCEEVATRPPEEGAARVIQRSFRHHVARKRTQSVLKDYKKRGYIIMELLATERSYVDYLSAVEDIFNKPLLEASHRRPVIPEASVRRIFKDWQMILNCNREFLALLDSRVGQWHTQATVGDIFMSMSRFMFPIYSSFVQNFTMAMNELNNCIKNTRGFKAWLDERYKDARLHLLQLPALLLMPVQRIPRYILLLQDMLKHTPSGHMDREMLQQALPQLRCVASKIDANEKTAANAAMMVELATKLKGFMNLIEPHRRFIRKGELKLKDPAGGADHQRHVYLFNDYLITANMKDEVREAVPLVGAHVAGVPSEESITLFEVMKDPTHLTFSSGSLSETMSWIEDLVHAIRNVDAHVASFQLATERMDRTRSRAGETSP